jgi:hypothetical protein
MKYQFGIFRQRHFKDQPVEFNPEKLNRKLKEIITEKGDKYQTFRVRIAWYFQQILDEDQSEFETLKPYIDLILEQPYQSDVYYAVGRIIADQIQNKPDICILWYKPMLARISEFADHAERSQVWPGLWLMHTKETIEAIAECNPSELSEIAKALVRLSKKGVFADRLGRLFELLSEKGPKKDIKEFQEWYDSMSDG